GCCEAKNRIPQADGEEDDAEAQVGGETRGRREAENRIPQADGEEDDAEAQVGGETRGRREAGISARRINCSRTKNQSPFVDRFE
ncbi:MAG: hypothetical protein P8Z42_07690, partial [Anaerolineales bacterium]